MKLVFDSYGLKCQARLHICMTAGILGHSWNTVEISTAAQTGWYSACSPPHLHVLLGILGVDLDGHRHHAMCLQADALRWGGLAEGRLLGRVDHRLQPMGAHLAGQSDVRFWHVSIHHA